MNILITGLMGSGKSTVLKEYMLNYKTIDFEKPSVEAFDGGLEFDFIDNVFAILDEKNNIKYNFYELDAPTIKKWTQFIQIANAIIIVYNHNPSNKIGSHKELLDIIMSNSDCPIVFVITNFKDKNKALVSFYEDYDPNHNNLKYSLKFLPKAESYFDKYFGPRFKINVETIGDIIHESIRLINKYTVTH